MKTKSISIRPFVGSKDFNISRNFYCDLGFNEIRISDSFSYFQLESVGFYLQDAYVKDWVDNTMLFLEVENVHEFWNELTHLKLDEKYQNIKLLPIKELDWGKECFIIDPSGILWHIGEFYS